MADRDFRTLARQLVVLIEGSRPLPLLRNQVWIKKLQVYELVGGMRTAVEAAGGTPQQFRELLSAAEAVEDAVYRAQPVPLTDDVRLLREQVDELLRALRAAGA